MFRFSSVSVSLSVTLMFHFVSIVLSFDTVLCKFVIVFHVCTCRLVRATWKISLC